MAGAPRFGNMSAGMRCTARMEQSATAITATITVTGRRMARRTSHIEDAYIVRGRRPAGDAHAGRSTRPCWIAALPASLRLPGAYGIVLRQSVPECRELNIGGVERPVGEPLDPFPSALWAQ